MPLASSLACLLLAFGEIKAASDLEAFEAQQYSFEEWAERVQAAFNRSIGRSHGYEELQKSVIELAQLSRAEVSRVMN